LYTFLQYDNNIPLYHLSFPTLINGVVSTAEVYTGGAILEVGKNSERLSIFGLVFTNCSLIPERGFGVAGKPTENRAHYLPNTYVVEPLHHVIRSLWLVCV
jgi:hypothetical protein